MLGPFSIDTYLPAFTASPTDRATPGRDAADAVGLPVRLRGHELFHGALSDSFGRRPVVLWGLAVFTLASVGCAMSQHIGARCSSRGTGHVGGGGIVISRAVIRTCPPPTRSA